MQGYDRQLLRASRTEGAHLKLQRTADGAENDWWGDRRKGKRARSYVIICKGESTHDPWVTDYFNSQYVHL